MYNKRKLSFFFLIYFSYFFLFSFEMIDIPEIIFYRPLKNGTEQEVTVSSFYMAKDDITMEDWFSYLDESDQSSELFKERFFKDWWESDIYEIDNSWPVFGISWLEAARFCNWLSEKYGYETCYTFNKKENGMDFVSWNKEANGYRLPTRAEWEAVSEIYTGKITEDYLYKTNISIYVGSIWYRPLGNKCTTNSYGVMNLIDDAGKFLWDYWNDEYENVFLKILNPTGPDTFMKPEKSIYDYSIQYYNLKINEIRVATKWCDINRIKLFVNHESIYEECETNDTTGAITIRLCRSKK